MFLYNVTLQRASQVTHAILGNFTGTKEQVRLRVDEGLALLLVTIKNYDPCDSGCWVWG